MMGRRRLGNSRNPPSGQNGRNQLQPQLTAFSHDIEDLFDDLALGSRFRRENGTQLGNFLRLRQPRSSQDSNGRSPPGRNVLARSRFPQLRARRNEMARDVLPFGRAMRRLFEQLIRAEKFYSSFQTDYDAEIDQIKNYANMKVLNELWMLRINGKKDPLTVLEGEDKDDDEALRDLKGNFDDMKRDIADALECAVESALVKDSYAARVIPAHFDSVRRMRRKVGTANEQILELLDTVKRRREVCVALLSELELLKDLIDPDLESNKILYRFGQDAIEDEDDAADEW